MRVTRVILVLAVAALLLAGCSSFKKLTGQRNDTVLPGQREDILPADQQVNPKLGKQSAQGECDPVVDVNCPANVDQEAAGGSSQ